MNPLAKLTSRERKILYAVIALVAGVLFYHAVWQPVAGKFSELNDQIFSIQMNLRKAKTFLQQRERILEEAKKYPNLQQMDARKDEEEIASLLNFIEQEARKANVSLSDVKPQSVKEDRLSKRYVVELVGESALKELVDFIYNLQFSEQMLKVDRVEIAPKQEGAETLQSSLVINRVVVK